MTITARHIDTCNGQYLTDHYNRSGQYLLSISLGQTVVEAVDDGMSQLTDDLIPDNIREEDIEYALRDELLGVDLCDFDDDGHRLPEGETNPLSESYAFILLEW